MVVSRVIYWCCKIIHATFAFRNQRCNVDVKEMTVSGWNHRGIPPWMPFSSPRKAATTRLLQIRHIHFAARDRIETRILWLGMTARQECARSSRCDIKPWTGSRDERRILSGWKVDSRGVTYRSRTSPRCTLVAFSEHPFMQMMHRCVLEILDSATLSYVECC